MLAWKEHYDKNYNRRCHRIFFSHHCHRTRNASGSTELFCRNSTMDHKHGEEYIMANFKIKITADDLSQAIGEYLYNKDKLPAGMEQGSVNFEVENGEFVITITDDNMPSMTIN